MVEITISRVPRPKGFGQLNSSSEKHLVGAKHLLATGKGFGLKYSNGMAAFRALGIPTHVWKKAVIEGLEGELDEQKLMLGGLYHLSMGSNEIDRLAEYLTQRVLEAPNAHPILVKEFNSLLSNRARLAEAFTKLGQARKEQGDDGLGQTIMTPYEILEVINGPFIEDSDPFRDRSKNPYNIEMAELAEEIEDTPECDPIPLDTSRRKLDKHDKPPPLPTRTEVVIAPK